MTAIITPQNAGELAAPIDLRTLGRAANAAASEAVFSTYDQRRAQNTTLRQKAGLALFARFIETIGGSAGDLAGDPQAWAGISWGLVEGFRNWLLKQGYAVSSVNVRLSTVKTYAKLAAKAGAIDPQELALIRAVDGFAHKEKPRIDEKRRDAGLPVRISTKKSEAVKFGAVQARELKQQTAGLDAADPKAGQARRDALLMALLIDHGLRVGELELLRVKDVNLRTGEFCFYRPKVDNTGCHTLSQDAAAAAAEYVRQDLAGAAPDAPLLKGSHKTGQLTGQLSARAINKRVRFLGEQLGLAGLSPHDCRHYAATRDAREGRSIDYMMQKYGWSSPAMAVRYIEAARVVKVD